MAGQLQLVGLLTQTALLDGRRLWGKLRRMAAAAPGMARALRDYASAAFAARGAGAANEAAALEAEAAAEGAEAVRRRWGERERHKALRRHYGMVDGRDPPEWLRWAAAAKRTKLADYALEWRATRAVPLGAAGAGAATVAMPEALARALEEYAEVLLEPEMGTLYGGDAAEAMLQALERTSAAATGAAPGARGSFRSVIEMLRETEAETLAYLGAEAEMNEACGVSMAAVFMELMEAVAANRERLVPDEEAWRRLVTECAVLMAICEKIVGAVEGDPAEGELEMLGTLRELAQRDAPEWRVLRTLVVVMGRTARVAWRRQARRGALVGA